MLGTTSFAQTPQGINYQAVAYDANGFELANQEISVRLGILLETADAESSYTETHQITTNDFGLFSLVISDGTTTDNFSVLNWENGAFLKIELDANLDGNYSLMGINSFSSVPYSLHSTFAENIPSSVSNEIDSLRNIVDIVSQYFGCKDHDACNYNVDATMSDNSCTYAQEGYYCDGECIDTDGDTICDLDEVEGCTDETACNYILGATNEDNSCIYQETYHNCQGDCENDDDGDGICDELEQGCTDETAYNYNPQALNSTNCIYSGCMDNTSGNYNPMANQDDDSCIPAEACPYPEYVEYDSTAASFSAGLCQTLAVYGCMEEFALNYDPEANVNQSCEHIYGCTKLWAENYNANATSIDYSCILHGCNNPIAENYNSFASINDETCIIYTSKIFGCKNITALNYNPSATHSNNSCQINGCTLEEYPNFNLQATIDDGSCDMLSLDRFGCTDSTTYGYNFQSNIDDGSCFIIPIGTIMDGGIVFYVDDSDDHGLIVCQDDISGTFGWGTNWSQDILGLQENIGTGLENTIRILDGINQFDTHAYYAYNYSLNGYDDWYLPSKDEMKTIIDRLNNSEYNDLIGFIPNGGSWGYYWSSSDCNSHNGWKTLFPNGTQSCSNTSKNEEHPIRPIRTF